MTERGVRVIGERFWGVDDHTELGEEVLRELVAADQSEGAPVQANLAAVVEISDCEKLVIVWSGLRNAVSANECA